MPLTTVNVNIKDSEGNPLAGYVRVTLDYEITDDSQAVSYVTAPADTPLVNGQCVLALEPSEIQRVTYRFQAFQENGTDDILVQDFRAKVPASLTPISWASLSRQTGLVRDTQDSSLAAVVNSLIANPSFWAQFSQTFYTDRGLYSDTEWYSLGDNVSFEGEMYRCISSTNIQGIPPNIPTAWFRWTFKGPAGSGTTGDPGNYTQAGWSGNSLAPTKAAIDNLVQNLPAMLLLNAKADVDGAVVSGMRLAAGSVPGANDNSDLVPSTSWVQALFSVFRNAATPIGTVAGYAGTSAPPGWILCDGRAVSRTTFSQLFTVLGTNFGPGDGSTTFNLPDFRGRTLVMPDATAVMGASNRNTAVNAVGASGGAARVTLGINEMPSHNHLPNTGVNPSLAINTTSGGTASFNVGTTVVAGQTANVGGGQSHENMPPYQAVAIVIYSGVV